MRDALAKSPPTRSPRRRHIGQSRNLGDGMDYGQRSHRGGLGEAVRRVLGVLEQRGGKDAFVNIK